MEEISTQTLRIEGHIKKKRIQVVKYHIEHQQQVLQLLKDNATLVQNRMKQEADEHRSERSFDVGDWVFYGYISRKILMRMKRWQYYMHLRNGDLT